MLKVLILKAGDTNVTVASNIILALGELVVAGGEDAAQHVPELMSVLIPRLEDTSLPKRDAAVTTLGKVCASTCYVIDPVVDHPEIVDLLGRILKSETRQNIRREVIRVFGIMGALDPFRRSVSLPSSVAVHSFANSGTQRKPIEESKTLSKPATSAIASIGLTSGSDDFYQKTVIKALLGVLNNRSLSAHHHAVIEAIMSMFKTQGLKCVAFLPQVCHSSSAPEMSD
jgi:FKBP12-rapamycin complex-associated protein